MASAEETPRSPLIANLVVILGFIAVFATFSADAPILWILGVGLIVIGGTWAGFSLGRTPVGGTPVGDDDELTPPGGQSHGGAH